MNISDLIRLELKENADPEKAAFLPKFFKAFPGGYGEGDRFIGVSVPNQRKIARRHYRNISLINLENLIRDPFHECRLTAIFILVFKYENAKTEFERKQVVDFYIGNLPSINNWDLVDSSAYKILGPFLSDKDRCLIYRLAKSGNLWRERIAVITTLHFVRNNDFDDTLKLSELLLDHEHDLIHKAVGWMLREVGNRDFDVEYFFLKTHYKKMPRTMLRYAIEKFEAGLRKKFLTGLV